MGSQGALIFYLIVGCVVFGRFVFTKNTGIQREECKTLFGLCFATLFIVMMISFKWSDIEIDPADQSIKMVRHSWWGLRSRSTSIELRSDRQFGDSPVWMSKDSKGEWSPAIMAGPEFYD